MSLEMKELQALYDQSIGNKLAEIGTLIDTLHDNRTPEAIEKFQIAVHKITGSAGSYGYCKVSLLCKEMESTLMSKIELTRDRLELFFKNLQKAFQWKQKKNV